MKRSYFFVRHGRAVYQERGFRKQDHPPGTDWPLAPAGYAQAERAARAIGQRGIEKIVSSTLERAVSTATAIGEATGIRYEARWAELNEVDPRLLRGAPEGPKWSWWDGYHAVRAYRNFVRSGDASSPYDVQPIHGRVRQVLSRLDTLDAERVVVVGHGFWILLAALSVGGEVRYRWLDNCSMTRIDANGRGAYRLVSFARPIAR